MIDAVGALGEVAKIAGGALAGGLVTWWLTRHNQHNRRKLAFSVDQTVPLGLPGFPIDVKVLFEGSEQDQIQFHVCHLRNLGSEHISEVTLIFWPKDEIEGEWILKCFNPVGPHLPDINVGSIDSEFVTLKIGPLASKEEAMFTLVSNRSIELNVKCKTENIRFLNQNDISEKRITLIRKALRSARAWPI